MSFWSGKNVLVTGGAGLTGHCAIQTLLDKGAIVRATQYHNRKIAITHKNLEIVDIDLNNYDECGRACKDIQYVVNTVAFIMGGKGQTENPMALIRSNLNPSVNMIEAACKMGVERFGFIGSSTSYLDRREPIKEVDAFIEDPHACYFGVGWMKRYCEKLAMYYHKISKTKFAMIRSTALYGPHDNFADGKGHVIPDLIRKASSRLDPFEIWGDGSQVRDFVYVQDLVDALLITIEKYAVADILNIATGNPTTVTELVQTVVDAFGYSPKFKYDPSKPIMIPYRMLDVSKAKDVLGWSAEVRLKDGIERTVEWFNQHVQNP
ncbi:MAG: NAD-dependent epimerase/dehydratase family protein [bacterium]|nr:NAD-dependent epimerase/dehydratase family protein [bacterium]